jgi:lipoate-protein ligase A
MTSINRERAEPVSSHQAAEAVVNSFSEVFGLAAQAVDASVLSPAVATR